MSLDYFKRLENFMFRKKVPPQVKVVLSDDDKRKIASFFVLLIAIDRRISKERASQKKSKLSQQKYDDLGSHADPLTGFLSEPFFILSKYEILLKNSC